MRADVVSVCLGLGLGLGLALGPPALLAAMTEVLVALFSFVLLASLQSAYELLTTFQCHLSSVPVLYVLGKQPEKRLPTLLDAGFRPDAVRKLPPAAYLHTTYGVDTSIAEELGTLVNIVVRDSVASWYKQLTTDDSFLAGVKLILCDILGTVAQRCMRHLQYHSAMALATDAVELVRLHLAAFRDMYATLAAAHPIEFDERDNVDARRRRVLEYIRHTPTPILHRGCHDSGYLKHLSLQLLTVCRPDADPRRDPGTLFSLGALTSHFLAEMVAKCIVEPMLAYSEPKHMNALLVASLPLASPLGESPIKQSYAASTTKRSAKWDEAELAKLWPDLEASSSMLLTTWTAEPPPPLLRSNACSSGKASAIKKKTSPLPSLMKMKARFRRLHSTNNGGKALAHEPVVDASASSAGDAVVTALTRAVDAMVQLLEGSSEARASGRSAEVHTLLSALEKVLLFGLQPSATYWTYLVEPRPEITFWKFRIDVVLSLPSATPSYDLCCARGLQWLLLGLEDGELWAYFTAFTLTTSLTEIYYEPYAILRDKQAMESVLQALFRLSAYSWESDLGSVLGRPDTVPTECSMVLDVACETERYLPLQGWVKSSDKRKRVDVLPSSEWVWASEWQLEGDWQYAKLSKDGFHDTERSLDCVRRRKWVRERCTRPYVLTPDDAVASQVQLDVAVEALDACGVCHRPVRHDSSKDGGVFECPICHRQCCFACSNHCIHEATGDQRVCNACYELNAARRRLRLTIASVVSADGGDNNGTGRHFRIDVVHTGTGTEWSLTKRWTDFEVLLAALETSGDVDMGQLRRLSLGKRTADELEASLLHRVLLDLLQCESLCQNLYVQQFFLDADMSAPCTPIAPVMPPRAKLGQLHLQKLELQVFQTLDEVFELDEVARLRRHALTLTRTLFRVSLNSTCHRLLGAQFAEWTQPRKVANVLFGLRAAVLPVDGARNPPEAPPTIDEMAQKMFACRDALLHACPSVVASVLGEPAARNGSLKVFEFLQHEFLVKSLLLSLLDLVVTRLFPEVKPGAPKVVLFT